MDALDRGGSKKNPGRRLITFSYVRWSEVRVISKNKLPIPYLRTGITRCGFMIVSCYLTLVLDDKM